MTENDIENRSVRVFLSSTFRDFDEERKLLVNEVFPSLRQKLKHRFVELVEVDLRWGITEEQAINGEVLDICLKEINNSRPYFVGMVGERYGWIPGEKDFKTKLLQDHDWIAKQGLKGTRSVTELEMIYGVIGNPESVKNGMFYLRDPAYAQQKAAQEPIRSDDFISRDPSDIEKLIALKSEIRKHKKELLLVDGYSSPEEFASRFESDLWKKLDKRFPEDKVPDDFTRESRFHQAYAHPRRKTYIGGESYEEALTKAIEGGTQRILIEGASGGGKSALIANWVKNYREGHEEDIVFEHYLASSAKATDSYQIIQRIAHHIKTETNSSHEIDTDPKKLLNSLPKWLSIAGDYCKNNNRQWIIILDALNNLSNQTSLDWLPDGELPDGVHLIISCLSEFDKKKNAIYPNLKTRGEWHSIAVEPLDRDSAHKIILSYLGNYFKKLEQVYLDEILQHSLSTNPLFLKILCEELRLYSTYDELGRQLTRYLNSNEVPELFVEVLLRIEGLKFCKSPQFKSAMTAIWASPKGLSEAEILGFTNMINLEWARIRNSLDESLIDSGGKLNFAHDYLKSGVQHTYLRFSANQSVDRSILARETLAQWFTEQWSDPKFDKGRICEIVPYLWFSNQDWARLKEFLLNKNHLLVMFEDRGFTEYQSYWRDIEEAQQGDFELELEAAWQSWNLPVGSADSAETTAKLTDFMRFSQRLKTGLIQRLAQSTVESIEQIPEHKRSQLAAAKSSLAEIQDMLGDYDSAIDTIRQSIAIMESNASYEAFDLVGYLRLLANLLAEQGDQEQAARLILRANAIADLDAVKDEFGPSHEKTAEAMMRLVEAMKVNGILAPAESIALRAIDLLKLSTGKDSREMADCKLSLAELLLVMKEFPRALESCAEAIEIRRKVYSEKNIMTAKAYQSRAMVHHAAGDITAAIADLELAGQLIVAATNKPEHPENIKIQKLLSEWQGAGSTPETKPAKPVETVVTKPEPVAVEQLQSQTTEVPGKSTPEMEEEFRDFIIWGNIEGVQELIAAGVNVNSMGEDGKSALIFAVARGHTEVVKLLLAAGADVNTKNSLGITPLIHAASMGHTEVVALLLAAKTNINVKDNDGNTALNAAANIGRTEVVKLLLAANADVSAKNVFGSTALNLAEEKNHTEIVNLLRAAMGDANESDGYRGTVRSKTQAVKPLEPVKDTHDSNLGTSWPTNLIQGFGNSITPQKQTAPIANKSTPTMEKQLAEFLLFRDINGVKKLIADGVNVNIIDSRGVTALYSALVFCPELVKLILDAGANVNVKNKDNEGETVLMYAAALGYDDMVNLFITAGADVNVKDNFGNTAMMKIVNKKFLTVYKVVELLINAGADVNAKNNSGNTALMFAIKSEPSYLAGMLKFLIAAGADVNAKNNEGKTVLQQLPFFGYSEIKTLLKNAGAK
ncbi:MAG: ankyrin repeat domain-containing protein [Candidatus Pacebacteria bacterium]|nr:ankyrin repeat domain-containing protein [Candidatus Paceibacterota bacterium]